MHTKTIFPKTPLVCVFAIVLLSAFASAGVVDRINNSIELYVNFEDASSPIVASYGNVNFTEAGGGALNYSMGGILNYSIGGDGTNDAAAGANSIFDWGTAVHSYNIWVYPKQDGTYQTILGQLTTAPWEFIDMDTSRYVSYKMYQGAGDRYYLKTDRKVNVSQWVMLTFIRSGSRSGKILINCKDRTTVAQNDGATNFNFAEDLASLFVATGDTFEWFGRLDEFSAYNEILNTSECEYLYNAGAPNSSQQYPFTNVSGGAPPAPGGIDWNYTIYTANNSRWDDDVYVNLTILSEVSPYWNCTHFVNYTPTGTMDIFTSNYTNNTNNYSLIYEAGPGGNITWYMKCTGDGGSLNNQTKLYNFVVDITNPEIKSNTPKEDNSTYLAGNETITLNVWTYDDYLYLVNLSIFNASGALMYNNYSNVSVKNYTWTSAVNVTTWQPGTYTMFVEASDSHTDNKLKKSFKPKLENEKISYYTTKYYGEAYVDFYRTSGDCDVDTFYDIEKLDRHSPVFEFKNCNGNHKETFILESSLKLRYLPDSAPEYNAHFVGSKGMQGFWFDANLVDDPNAEYEVKKLTDYKYEIEVKTKKPKLEFESLGGLNYNNLTVTFRKFVNVTIRVNETAIPQLITNYTGTVGAYSVNSGDVTQVEVWAPANLSQTITANKTGYSIDSVLKYVGFQPFSITLNGSSAGVTLYFYEEIDQSLMSGTNIDIEIISLTGNTSVLTNTSTGTKTVTGLAIGNYEIKYSADGYFTDIYYAFLNTTATQTINLYMLNTTNGQRITHSLFDQDSEPAVNVRIQILRNYITGGVSEYKTVRMAQTNYEGRASLHIQPYDVWYKMIYTDTEGNILKITDASPFFDAESTDSVQLIADNYEGFRRSSTVNYNLSWVTNLANDTWARFFWHSPAGTVANGCLRVDFIDRAGELTNVHYNCTVASTAILTYQINKSLEGTYKANAIIDTNTTFSYFNLDTIFYKTILEDVDLGREGVFYSMLLIGSVGLMGLASVTASLAFMFIALIGVSVVGLLTGFQLSYLYFIAVLILIVIFMVRRSTQ